MSYKEQSEVSAVSRKLVNEVIELVHLSGLTVVDYCKMADVNRPYFYRVRDGKNVPTLDWVAKLLRPLNAELCVRKKKTAAKRRKVA